MSTPRHLRRLPENATCERCGKTATQYGCSEKLEEINSTDRDYIERYSQWRDGVHFILGTEPDETFPLDKQGHEWEVCGYCSCARWVLHRRIVRTFKPQFAPLVESGAKLQTIRPVPKIMPRSGDIFDARQWTGLPYRSKQRKLGEWPIERVDAVRIHASGQIEISGRYLSTLEMEAIAQADGFTDLDSMLSWFRAQHGLPFEGIVIHWSR